MSNSNILQIKEEMMAILLSNKENEISVEKKALYKII